MVGGEKSKIEYWPWQVAIYHHGLYMWLCYFMLLLFPFKHNFMCFSRIFKGARRSSDLSCIQ